MTATAATKVTFHQSNGIQTSTTKEVQMTDRVCLSDETFVLCRVRQAVQTETVTVMSGSAPR